MGTVTMDAPLELDFRTRLVLPELERLPDGALRLSLTAQGKTRLVLDLSYPSLEALWFELTVVLAELRRC
jgi:hypothetical protein